MLPLLLVSGILLAPATQTPGVFTPAAVRANPLATTVPTASVTPAAITFSATDPDTTPVVNGSASAVVAWTTKGGATARTWNVTAKAAATTFSSCSTVPVSAVTVTCASVTGGHSGVCSAATTLSTTATQVASGDEATGTASYSVTLSFTLADNWKYIASSSCSLSVSYTITAN